MYGCLSDGARLPGGCETLVNQSRSSRLRIGIDPVAVGEVAASLARFGHRYTNRVFTANERIDCEENVASDGFVNKDVEAARYAAHFAAKEAVIKVLRPSGARPQWRSIAMMRAPYGGLTVALHDIAAELADNQGICTIEISVTHEGEYAAAIAVAECEGKQSVQNRRKRWRSASARF